MESHHSLCRRCLGTAALAAILCTGLITTAVCVRAQDHRNNPEHRRPVERTLRDLTEITGRLAPRGDERRRFDDAIRHLQQFADRLHERGQFDKGKLDESIGNVQNLLDHARMPEEPREILSRDVTELRRFRQHYEDERGRH